MLKRFCDRCKKEIPKLSQEERNIRINEYKKYTSQTHIDIYVCEECMNDFINYIEFECDRYEFETISIVSKEADGSDV